MKISEMIINLEKIKQKLPYDVARCSGVRVAALCNQCLRKTAPGRPDGPQVYISPQVFDAEIGIEQCRNHISANRSNP